MKKLVWARRSQAQRIESSINYDLSVFSTATLSPPPPLPSVLDKNHASKILILCEMHSKNIWYPYYLPLLSPMFSFFDFLFKVDKPGLMAWLFRWLGFVIFKDIGPPPPNPLKSVQNSNMCETRLGCFYVTAILSWGYGWGWIEDDIEAEVDLKFEPEVEMRLRWDWDQIESKFSLNWVEVELSWSWDKLTLNKGRNWAFIGVGLWFKICFRSTYVAEQLLFSMLLLISSN